MSILISLLFTANSGHEFTEITLSEIGRDYVPDEATAIRIAEAIWLPIYGEGVQNKKPYCTDLVGDSTWVVSGSLPDGRMGGVPYIKIRKSDCKILSVYHTK